MTSVISALMAVKTCSKAISAYDLGHGKSPCFSQVTFLQLFGPDFSQSILRCVDVGEFLSVPLIWKTLKNLFKTRKKSVTKATNEPA